MAKQFGMINIRGSLGDMTYVRTEDGYQIRCKSSLDRNRVLTDPKFSASRRAGKEFGTAAKAGKLLRTAVLGTLKNAGDSKLQSRMLKQMHIILKTDTVSDAGERIPELGQMELLRGFEFNNKNELVNTMPVQYTATVDRDGGEANIAFPAFHPREDLPVREGATHFKLLSAAAVLDFRANKSFVAAAESDHFAVNATALSGFSLQQSFASAGTLPVVLVLGIRFYKLVNGNYHQLHADDFNAVRVVAVA